MRPKNWRLTAMVAAVAVAAIAAGGALAHRQGPRNSPSANAAPLSGSRSPTPTPTPPPTTTPPTQTASVTPPKPPSTKPSRTPTTTGPVKRTVNVAKLRQGRAPQVTYVSGRTVRGGPGSVVTIPGSADIHQVARLNNAVLAVVGKGTGSEMLTVDSQNRIVRRTPDVSAIVTTEDGLAAAYVATRRDESGGPLPGATVYAEQSSVQKLTLPAIGDARLLGYVNGKVYFRGQAEDRASTWTLYEWIPGTSKATPVKTVPQATALSGDGRTATSLNVLTDFHSCSNVVEVATGRRLWRSCDYQLRGFTPSGATVIGSPYNAEGYAATLASALDTKTGTLLREWTGTFLDTVAEDDQHLLIVAVASGGGGEPGTRSAIIRCSITTGVCELATPISTDKLLAFDG